MWNRAVVVFALIVAATPASAQRATSQAEEMYDKARALVAAGNTAEACAAFEQSQKLAPAVTTLIALGTCRERLGQLATAWSLFVEAERQSRSARDDTTVQYHQIALDRAAKLERRISKLTITVPAASRIDGLQIFRDKYRLPEGDWNRTLGIDGGSYTITARAPGANEWTARVTVASEADAKTIDVPDLRASKRSLEERPQERALNQPTIEPQITTPASGAASAAQPTSLAQAAGAPRPRRGLAPLALGASAVVLLGGALGLSLWGDSTYEAARAEMTDLERRHSLYDSANQKRYAAQGFAVAGVGCVGVAVWLYLRQRSTRAQPTASHATRLMLSPTTASVGIFGQF